jgi:hypothetical protein
MIPEALIKRLHELNEPVPIPRRLPTPAQVAEIEKQLGVVLHPDMRQFLLEASDVVFGMFEPVTVTIPDAHTHVVSVCKKAWDCYSLPGDLIPICEDNADFFCMNKAGEVVFWSHNGWKPEKWSSLAEWIEAVWIGWYESAENDAGE